MNKITVIGAGLAGCEAAYTIAKCGIKVDLIEMKPHKKSPAHKSDNFAELVCSNSLKANRIESAAGLLKQEMRILGSLCLEAANNSQVPAGGALAVDRDVFSEYITQKIKTTETLKTLIKPTRRCLTDEAITYSNFNKPINTFTKDERKTIIKSSSKSLFSLSSLSLIDLPINFL